MKFLILLAAIPTFAFGMECDNFSERDRAVKDSLEVIDEYTNKQMQLAVIKANSRGSCDRDRLYSRLESTLGHTPRGQVEAWAEKSKDVEKLVDDQDGPESIYNGVSFLDYPLLKLGGIAHSIKIAGHVIGTDKLGHFMGEGLSYYKMTNGKEEQLPKAMDWGIRTEETYFGWDVSGIKSYADLATNYSGWHFWTSILDGKDPYFACNNGRFEQIRRFTWKDYVSDAWDEAINCSVFTRSMAPVVERNLKKKGMTCPVQGQESTCRYFILMPFAAKYISPVCMGMLPGGGNLVNEMLEEVTP
jgi:hypothetical protein